MFLFILELLTQFLVVHKNHPRDFHMSLNMPLSKKSRAHEVNDSDLSAPIAQYLPWTFPWNVRKVPSERSRNVPRTKKMSGFFERSKAMFSECSCGTFQERSKGILRERSAAIFREYSKRTFLEPSIGTFREHLYRTFVELFVGTFREHSQRTFWNIPREHLGNIFWECSWNYFLQHSGNFLYR